MLIAEANLSRANPPTCTNRAHHHRIELSGLTPLPSPIPPRDCGSAIAPGAPKAVPKCGSHSRRTASDRNLTHANPHDSIPQHHYRH